MKALVILAGCAVAAWLTPHVFRHVQRVRLASQCVAYAVPPGTVAYEFTHDRRSSALANDPRYEHLTSGLGLVPKPWRELHHRLHDSPLWSSGTVFLGARHSHRTRAQRLVTVDVCQSGFTREGLRLAWRVYDVSSSRSGPVCLNVGIFDEPSVQLFYASDPVRVYAAVPDPADDSHFTIEVEVEKPGDPYHRRYVIDGWVRDNDVLMATRNPLDTSTILPAAEEQTLPY